MSFMLILKPHFKALNTFACFFLPARIILCQWLFDVKETGVLSTCKASPRAWSLLFMAACYVLFFFTPMCQLNSHTSPNGTGIQCYQTWCLREIVLICIISKWHGDFCMEIFVWIEPGILIAESKLSSINSPSPMEKSSNCCKLSLVAERRVGLK